MTEPLRTDIPAIDGVFPGFPRGRVTYVAGGRQVGKTRALLGAVDRVLRTEGPRAMVLFRTWHEADTVVRRGLPRGAVGTERWSRATGAALPNWDHFQGRPLSLVAFDEPPADVDLEELEGFAAWTGAAVVLAGGPLAGPLFGWQQAVAFDLRQGIMLGLYTRDPPPDRAAPIPIRSRYERCLDGLDV